MSAEPGHSSSESTPRWATTSKPERNNDKPQILLPQHNKWEFTISGTNRTSKVTGNSKTLFEAVLMVDDLLTEGPDPKSKLVGRAQGLYGSACQSELGLIMAMNYQFTDGEYKGSLFSILGLNQAMDPVREMSVVTGTGKFRMARRYALAHIGLIRPPEMLL